MMQAGVCLRQDTETTLPELTEQHRIRLKEEELSGLESETECAAPGLNTLEPECVTAHSGVSDGHHTHTSVIKTETDLGSTCTVDLIKTESLDFTELVCRTHLHPDRMKTETDLGSTHTGDLIKTESPERTELGYVTHLHPDQIKTEADDGGYLKAEHISDFLDIKCVDIKCDQIKCESSESLVSDLTVTVGAGVENKDITEPWQCVGEPNPNCKKESHELSIQCGDLNHHYDGTNESNQMFHDSRNGCQNDLNFQNINVMIEPKIAHSSKNSRLLKFNQNKTIPKNKGEKPHKCMQCEKCFCKKSDLNAHLRIHTGEKPYKCTQCEKCFCRKSDLNTHLRIHTGEKPYKCTLCGKYFSHTSGLKCHKMVHTGEKPYKCPQCEKCFSKISHLNIHQRIHTGEKPFKCTQCGKCFSHRTGFNCHLMSHTGEKPYSCPQCEKCFYTISHLNIHHRIHTGEKPYKCIQCGKCFSQTSALNRHKMTHTGESPAVAPI
ncbi:zinc finger protein 271-like [Conger conger]|uniref:zinc finger protein 271-like n=1 Tax=Conger conger TaxID=82655 RepID=UPI002A5AA5AC|nr:zinc finger protein 271-like [Conger conger]